jgi:ACS family tartrate transporter-like MFS transporter
MNATSHDDAAGRSAVRKVSWHVLPLLSLGFLIAYLDRLNISFAALQMNQDLGFSASIYGFGAGLFFLSYSLLEIPSNLLLVKFGARRWISRIMLTWGIIAVGMMFVRTPSQFYCMRFLLGAAEAGFYPGVLYYLTNWIPATHSGRALGVFIFAAPLSSALSAAIAGPILSLRGIAGLQGWQWLFLIEGAPAIILSILIFLRLPDSVATAKWLSDGERTWLTSKLSGDETRAFQSLRLSEIFANPAIWTLALWYFLVGGAGYSFTLFAPTLLKEVTQWSATRVGLLLSCGALVGAGALVLNGWHSDRSRERYLHAAIPQALMAAAVATLGLSRLPEVIVPAYLVYAVSSWATQAAFWSIPSGMLRGRAAAAGIALIGSAGSLGGFVGPYAFGLARDATGSYRASLLMLAALYLVAGTILLRLRRASQLGAIVKSN